MKMKSLIKKFSFNQILEEIKRQNWKLPSAEEVKQFSDTNFESVWVRDIIPLKEDRATHAALYIIKKDKIIICNKMFMENIVVIKEKKEIMMNENMLFVQLDINENPFVVNACMTDGTEKKQSTMEYLMEDFGNFGNWNDVGVPAEPGLYSLKVKFYPPDDVDNIFTKVKDE